ncbi:hypothetical protein CHLRE_11g467686v5 [Chlamydomonas reinhardtii]|uniref:Peptidase M11 gametolysin domain-containing protein n=1 Tax=Chlamydomonas reinhardtii TaxID=3055 RepID=A0A2K3D7P6_CHLRE|nr:uncharacterized protein CHLRE_11g467686v5 [Chlamydomonas reinhardtii]PNW76550.1 hypothetical protein CHLRE_11g467686v5 [Chlamydomonas reinhardtii]
MDTDTDCSHLGPELQGILFGAADGGGLLEGTSGSVAGYLGFCSNGRRTLSPGNAIIAEGVAIPCNGTNSYGARWSTSRCTTMDLYGWAESALDMAVGQLDPQVLDRIQHVVVITPDGSWWKPRYDPTNCAAYLASGEVGRGRQLPGTAGGSFGFVWVTGERRSVLNTYLHELSHNLGLYHAGTTESCQYCDRACALGGCCLARCHNAAHLWALGWADPVEGGSLVLEGLTEGLTLPYRLPAQHSSDASFVMIDASPGNPNGTRVFLSYRRLRPPYESFDSQLDNSVLVHRYLSGGSRLGNMDTQFLARLAPPSPVAAGRAAGSGGSGNGSGVAAVWRDDTTRLWVQVLGSDGAAAAVTVCRAPLLSTAVGAGSPAATAGDGSDSSGSSSGSSSSNGAASPPSSSSAVDWSACQRAQPDPASVLQTMGMAQRLPAALQLSVMAAPPPAPPPTPPPTPPPRPRPQAQAAVAAPDAVAALLRRDDGSPPLSPAPVPLSPSLSPSRAPGSSQAAEASRRGTGRRRGDVAGASSPPAPQPPPLPSSPSPPAPVPAPDTGAAAAPAPGPAGGGSSGRRKRPPPPAPVESSVGMGARRTAAAGTPPAAAASTRPSDSRGVRRLAGQVPWGPRT